MSEDCPWFVLEDEDEDEEETSNETTDVDE